MADENIVITEFRSATDTVFSLQNSNQTCLRFTSMGCLASSRLMALNVCFSSSKNALQYNYHFSWNCISEFFSSLHSEWSVENVLQRYSTSSASTCFDSHTSATNADKWLPENSSVNAPVPSLTKMSGSVDFIKSCKTFLSGAFS